jgi:gliding motility-associated-like protein
MRRLILLAGVLLFSVFSTAQNFSNKGKDFWVAYGYHVRMSTNAQDMVLYFATEEVTNILISIPALGYSQTLTSPATPTVLTSAPIPKTGAQDARLLAESTAPEDKGIHITSDKPMVAYAHIYNSNVSGASILFPSNTLGKEYYSVNYTNVSNENNSNPWFYVIATDTGTTTIEITPAANTINHAGGVPFTVNLTQGQVFNLMGQLTGGGGGGGGGTFNAVDLTGSKIKSIASGNGVCKRIAVFSGSGKIGINCGSGQLSADNYMVQAFPKDAWGKKFLTAPTSSLNRNIYRICVADPATAVTLNGAPIGLPLNNNFYYEISATSSPLKIESDLPITVAQYITTQGACGNPSSATNPGDPEVIYLSPVEQNISKVLWNATPNFNITQHYYNVVIPNTGTAISSFRLDGVAVNPTLFTVHPQDPGFSYLRAQLTNSGVHSIESDSGFNAIAYGFGSAESYGYNAGTNIRDLYNFLQPLNPLSLVPDPVACTGTPVYLTVTFPFQPTSLFWNFYNNPNQSPNNNVLVNAPVADTTYFIGVKQVWRYKLPLLYNFSLANSSPGYQISITAGTTSTEGCGSSIDRDFYLAVYDPPVAQLYFTNNGCVTDSVRFRDTTVYFPGTYSYKWHWDFGDGTTDSVRHPVHRYANAGTYTVKFSLLSNVGCYSDTATEQVTVTDVPTVSFSNSTPLCQGSAITFTSNAAVTSPGNLQKWYWNFGDGNTQVITAPTSPTVQHTYSPWGNYFPSLRVETNSGCTSIIDTTQIYIGPIPQANFSIPNVVCLPYDTAQFTNLSTIADGSQNLFSHLWTFGDPASGSNDTSRLSNPSHYYNNAGPFSVHLTVTSANGCVDDTIRLMNTVNLQPQSSFTAAPENCLNTATNFSSTSTGSGHPITNWYWDFGDGSPIGSGQNPSHTYATPGNKIIKHWVMTNMGCLSDTSTFTVYIIPLPTASFTTTGPYCGGREITFTNTSVANYGIINAWAWNMGDGNNYAYTNGNPFTHIYNASGPVNVTLQVTTDKGCVSILLNQPVTISPTPLAGFIDPEVCLSDTYAQFQDTSTVASGSIVAWYWDFDHPASGPLNNSTQQNPRHSYSTIGTKNVTLIVTTDQGCKDTLTQSFFVNGDIPVAGFQVLNPNRLCANDSVRIKDVSTVNVGSIIKTEIYWDLTGASGTFEVDDLPAPGKIYSHLYPNFQTPSTRTYTIKFKSYSGLTCVDSSIRTITINAAPRVRFDVIPDTCRYISPFALTQAVEIGGVPGTFVFSGAGISPNGIFNPAIVGPGQYPIHYVYTSNFGCADSADQPIRILEPPTANFGFSSPACEGKAITFTDTSRTSVNSGPLATWTWNFNDGTTNLIRTTSTPFTHVFSNYGMYNVSLMVTTAGGCNSINRVKEVFVNPQPLSKFTFTDTACLPNAKIDFQATSIIADGTQNTFRYAWNFGDPGSGVQNTSIARNPSHIYNTLGPFPVTLRTTSAVGCFDDTLINVNTIHPQPDADFSFNKPSVCIGDNVMLMDQSDPKDGNLYQWYWTIEGGGSSTQQNPVYTFPAVGNFDVQLYMINSFGCVSDTAVKSFNVYPYPVISAGPDLMILEGQSQPLQATATGTNLQYAWSPTTYLNNTSVLNPACAPVNDINYTLTVTGIGGCPSVDEMKVVVLKIPLVPNTFSPNGDGINDLWEIEYLKKYPYAKVQVFTRTGQLVFESKGYQKPWNGTRNGAALPVDTYYYIIEPESGRAPVTGYVTIIK